MSPALRTYYITALCRCVLIFKNIDKVIATIKAAAIKNKDRKKDFHDAGRPSSPDPVITRWATWLRAALYYSENLQLFVPLLTIGQVQAV